MYWKPSCCRQTLIHSSQWSKIHRACKESDYNEFSFCNEKKENRKLAGVAFIVSFLRYLSREISGFFQCSNISMLHRCPHEHAKKYCYPILRKHNWSLYSLRCAEQLAVENQRVPLGSQQLFLNCSCMFVEDSLSLFRALCCTGGLTQKLSHSVLI